MSCIFHADNRLRTQSPFDAHSCLPKHTVRTTLFQPVLGMSRSISLDLFGDRAPGTSHRKGFVVLLRAILRTFQGMIVRLAIRRYRSNSDQG